MNEIHTQYRKLGIMVLAKALDDICPTFQGEEEEEKTLKIKDRVAFFARSEVDVDKEWEDLESEAKLELQDFIKERDTIFVKLAKTNNSKRVEAKVKLFESKKQDRVNYLTRKMDREVSLLEEKLLTLGKDSRKYTQIFDKLENTKKTTAAKTKKAEIRYNTIIKNTANSDNAFRVEQRIEQSKKVWNRKYNELKDKHTVKETIHNSKRMEYDQIRISILSFSEDVKHIEQWCTLSGVALKECYTEAIRRAKMVNRDYAGIDKVLGQISAGVI